MPESDTGLHADGQLRSAVEAALRTDVYADGERFFEMRDEDFDAWMKRGTNSGKVAPWAQDIDRLLRQVRGVRAALRAEEDR